MKIRFIRVVILRYQYHANGFSDRAMGFRALGAHAEWSNRFEPSSLSPTEICEEPQ